MGRKSKSLGIMVVAGCLMALSVTAQAATVRVEAEEVPTLSWVNNVFPSYIFHDDTTSGTFYVRLEAGWIYFENIIAPADGTYDVTFRLRSGWTDGYTEFYTKNTVEEIWVSSCDIGLGITEWYDFAISCNLRAGANTLEVGGCNAYHWIDYIEFDDSTGLRYEPVLKYHPLRIEAENGTPSGNTGAISVVNDATASGGKRLSFTAPGGTLAYVSYNITVPDTQGGGKYVYVRIAGKHPSYPDGDTGSDPHGSAMGSTCFLRVDDALVDKPGIPNNDADWHERVLSEFWLDAGEHTITLASQWSSLQWDYIEFDGLGTDTDPVGDITRSGEMNVGETISLTAPATVCTLDGSHFYWIDPYPAWNYQWMLNGDLLTGATDRVLVIDDLTAGESGDSGDYTVSYVQNEGDELVSNPYTVTVSVPGSEPIVSDPIPGFIVDGGPLTLTAPADALSYLWRFNGEDMSDTDRITGVNSRVLVFSPVSMLDDEGTYTCVYDDGSGKEIFETPPFELDVLPAGSVPVAGIIGLALLAASTAWGGALAVRRKKH
jgi:hypothetical protein